MPVITLKHNLISFMIQDSKTTLEYGFNVADFIYSVCKRIFTIHLQDTIQVLCK